MYNLTIRDYLLDTLNSTLMWLIHEPKSKKKLCFLRQDRKGVDFVFNKQKKISMEYRRHSQFGFQQRSIVTEMQWQP